MLPSLGCWPLCACWYFPQTCPGPGPLAYEPHVWSGLSALLCTCSTAAVDRPEPLPRGPLGFAPASESPHHEVIQIFPRFLNSALPGYRENWTE